MPHKTAQRIEQCLLTLTEKGDDPKVLRETVAILREQLALRTTATLADAMRQGQTAAGVEVQTLAQLPEENPDPVFRADHDGLVIYANAPAKAILGELGWKAGKLLPEPFLLPIRGALAQRHIAEVEVPVCSDRIMSFVLVPSHNDGHVSLYGRDITEGKRAETQLRLRAGALESAANGIALTDARGMILWVNRAFAAMTGYAVEELIGRNPRILKSGQQDEAFYRHMWQTISGGRVWHGELMNRRKDGTLYDEEMTITPVPGEDGGHYIAVKQDVTGRKARENQLQHLNRILQAKSNSSRAMLRATDESSYLREVCRIIVQDCGQAMVWVGYAQDDAARSVVPVAQAGFDEGYLKTLQITWADEDRGRGPTGTAIRTGQPSVCRNMLTDPRFAPWRAEAIKRGYASSLVLPLLAGNKAFGALTIYARQADGFSDDEARLLSDLANDLAYGITAVRLRRDQLRVEQELQQAKDVAEAANRAKDHFLAVLSHELRTPLTPVLTTAQMLEMDPALSPEQRDAVSMIRRNAELEARLIDDLLDLTKIARGKLELSVTIVGLHERLRHVLAMCENDITAKQLNLKVQMEAKSRYVSADPTRLQQILWNLLRNAVKFTPVGGSISVRTHNPDDGHVVVAIQDTGAGIEPELLPRLFTAFEQGRKDVTRQFGGLGLGLAISKGLVDLHGGTLVAASEGQGRGATFTLTLRALSDARSTRPHALAHAPLQALGARRRILLVEDHADTARVMSMLLKSHGCSVTLAGSVQEALQTLQTDAFDLLISDIGLPDGSGLDMMRQIAATKPMKAIALSGYGMEEDVRKSKEAGFVAHLTKPVDIQALERMLREILGGSSS